MIRGRDIVFISSIEWDQLWQSHHELAARLAASGVRVLSVENIGVRTQGWKDRARVFARVMPVVARARRRRRATDRSAAVGHRAAAHAAVRLAARGVR